MWVWMSACSTMTLHKKCIAFGFKLDPEKFNSSCCCCCCSFIIVLHQWAELHNTLANLFYGPPYLVPRSLKDCNLVYLIVQLNEGEVQYFWGPNTFAVYSVFYLKNVEFQTWSAHCILLPKLSKNEPVCIHIHSIHSLLYQQIKAGKQNIKVTISFDQALEIGFIGSPHLLIRYIWMDFIRAPLGNARHLREMRWFLSISVQFFFFF